MSLYQINNEKLELIRKIEFRYERELQKLTEDNLETIFNLKFVATEFQLDNLRIDTLAFNEETKSFVIIEYKKTKNFSVIDQGYSYLSLLLNNKAEFVLKYNQKFNTNYGKEDFDFSQTIVMFIAPSYTTYQLKSVEFNDLAFELWKVSKFSNNTVSFDKVNIGENKASIKEVSSISTNSVSNKVNREIKQYTEKDIFKNSTEKAWELYEMLKEMIDSQFDDVTLKFTMLYVSFRTNNKIIMTVEPRSDYLVSWINLKESKIKDPEFKTRDVTGKGHHGVGDFEIKLRTEEDLFYYIRLFKQSYDEKNKQP